MSRTLRPRTIPFPKPRSIHLADVIIPPQNSTLAIELHITEGPMEGCLEAFSLGDGRVLNVVVTSRDDKATRPKPRLRIADL